MAVPDFTYDGMTTVPLEGGEGRKFTIYADGHPNFEIVDQFDAAAGTYQIRAMYSKGHWHVFSTVQHNKVCDIIEDFPAGETASSSEELEALFETAADEKLTEFHRIQSSVEARGAPKRKERGARLWNPTGAGSPLLPPGGPEPP